MSDEISVYVIKNRHGGYSLQYVDPVSGKRVSKSAGTKLKKHAEKAAIKWQTELQHGIHNEPSKLSWVQFRERYEHDYMQRELKETSQERIHATLNVIERLMSPKRLNQITSQWVTQFRLKAAEGRSMETVNVHLRNLKAMLNWAKSQEMIKELPQIKQSKRAKTAKQMKGRPVTSEEFDRLLAQVPNVSAIGSKWAKDWQRFLQGLWWSGLRLAEAINLTWDQWADSIRVSISKDGYVFLLISADDEKGGKDRVYPVAPEFAEMLLSVPEGERQGLVFSLPQKGGMASLVTEVGRKISEAGKLAKIKVDVREKAGKTVTKFASAHDLRRAFGLRWSRRIFPAELMELMRHENIETTMAYYVGQQAELTARKLYEALDREKAQQADLSPRDVSTHPFTHP